MATVWLYTIVSVIIVSLISLAGIVALAMREHWLRRTLALLVSFAVGALLGDALFHLLPATIEESGGLTTKMSMAILVGIFAFFVLEKLVIWQHCHTDSLHAHDPHHTDKLCRHHVHPVAYNNLIGDAIHNLIDGSIIAAAYMADFGVGIATTIAVILHEIPQEIGDFGILIHGGLSRGKAIFLNFLTALTAILGAIVTLLVGQRLTSVVDLLIPFTVGAFLYIASSDLIPELHKETKPWRSLLQIVALVAGLAVMYALLGLEGLIAY